MKIILENQYSMQFGFVLGFTMSFAILSVIASLLGNLFSQYIKYIKVFFGIIIIILGFNYMEVFNINFLNKTGGIKFKFQKANFLKTFLFGFIFSISWTPCIGSFLSSALMLIAKEHNIINGIVLICIYSFGLGLPFIISAIFINKLKNAFDFIKKHYKVVKEISGIILIIMGIYIIFY